MSPGEWGQVVTVWLIVAAIAAPFVGRWLKRVRKTTTVRLPRDPMKYEGRDLSREQLIEAYRSDLAADSEYQQRARRAEGLEDSWDREMGDVA